MKYIYTVSLCGTSNGGNKVHFRAKVTTAKLFEFNGDASKIKSALKPLVSRQNPSVYEQNNVKPASVFVESFSHITENDNSYSDYKPSKKSNSNSNFSIMGALLKLITFPFRFLFRSVMKLLGE